MLEKSNAKSIGPSLKDSKPDLSVVQSLLTEAQVRFKRSQKGKTGRAKHWFRSFFTILGEHNYLFDLLPTGDKYTSVVTGSFTAIVKACATYEEIGEGIADYLERISDEMFHLRQVVQQLCGRDDPYIRAQTVNFYCELFNFMVSLLENWYTSPIKRIMMSLGDKYKKSCDEALKRMHRYRKGAQDQLRNVYSGHIDKRLNYELVLGLYAEAGLYSEAHRHATMPKALSTSTSSTVEVIQSLSCSPLPSSHDNDDVLQLVPDEPGLDDLDGHESSWTLEWTKQSIVTSAAPLEQYYQSDRIKRLMDRTSNLSISREVFTKIHKWLTAADPEAIALQGPPGVKEPSECTLTSAFVLRKVTEAKVPVIGYFCHYDSRAWASFDRTKQLLHLVNSLIYQLSSILPEGTDAEQYVDLDFSPTRWSVLDEDASDIDAAIQLLGDLLKMAPPLLFCIIDGLRHVDTESNPPELKVSIEKFLRMLCTTASTKSDSNGALKLLISTNGSSLALRKREREGLLAIIRNNDQSHGNEPMRIQQDLAVTRNNDQSHPNEPIKMKLDHRP